jgi:8-oxo-dGTP diphosphatase
MIDVVCGVIEDREGRFLACLRPQGKHLGGLWEFPGGKVEVGEIPAAALARELLEELSVEVEVGPPLTPVIWAYTERTIRLLPFRCRIIGGELYATEHEELRWCSPENFHELPWADADLPILREIAPAGP